jgi:hypothetical protein
MVRSNHWIQVNSARFDFVEVMTDHTTLRPDVAEDRSSELPTRTAIDTNDIQF